MRTANSRRATLMLLSLSLLLWSAVGTRAQSREKFGISAKAGGINAVTGRADVHLKGAADWQPLSITDDLEAGDVVRTESGGRLEMLLNPGSYLRLGENSQFELVDNALDKLEVRLLRGTAIVEVTGADDTQLLINISTPHARLAIVRHGLYRVNVFPENATELIVRKGRVMLSDSHTKVGGGNKVVFSATSVSVAKLQKAEKKDRDDLDTWSKGRAETVAQANRRLGGRDLDRVLGNTWANSFWQPSRGVWLFSSRFGCYTFLPFYPGWSSPYGAGYSSIYFSNRDCCSNGRYYPGTGNRVGFSTSTTGGGYGGGRGNAGSGSSASNQPAPVLPSPPVSVPRSAAGKVQRVNDRQP